MSLVGSIIVPHPPVMVPSVGGQDGLKPIEKTVAAMLEVSHKVSELKPDTVVVIAPHGPVYPDRINIRIPEDGRLIGNFSRFGSAEELEILSDNDFADKILDAGISAALKLLVIDDGDIDHGVLVPMYYIDKVLDGKYKMVSVNISFSSYKTHYDFGKVLRNVFDEDSRRVLFVASADLSHCLKEDAPAGYSEVGEEFDRKLVNLVKKGHTDAILGLDPFWVDEAKECGLRSVCTALGVAGKHEVYSYECPYGVGYMVAGSFDIGK